MWQRSSKCETSACVEVGFSKSSRSYQSDCVEVGFSKSSRSSGSGNCVEVATCTCDEVLVRDSKDPDGPMLRFPHGRFTEFLAGVKAGQFD